MPDQTTTAAFEDDLAYLAAEVEWVKARCRRIGVEHRLAEDDTFHEERGVVGKAERTSLKELSRRLPALREAEDALRKELDTRLAVNRTTGPGLGLDALCEEHRLDHFERTVLLLGAYAAVGHEHENTFFRGELGHHRLNPEVIWAFEGLSLAERVESRVSFAATAPLLRAGLVTIYHGNTLSPCDLPEAIIEVTSTAFDRIVGIPDTSPAAEA
jgi:hypothetical protein